MGSSLAERPVGSAVAGAVLALALGIFGCGVPRGQATGSG